jgi:hypothetical protein
MLGHCARVLAAGTIPIGAMRCALAHQVDTPAGPCALNIAEVNDPSNGMQHQLPE